MNQLPVMQQLNDTNNLNKYKTAGLIATKVVNQIVNMAKINVKLLDLVTNGNKLISSELDKVYKDVKNKGLAFPICLSINQIAGHYIPNETDVLKDGDILKIELGVQIDGFPAFIVFSTLIQSTLEKREKLNDNDKRSNVMRAVIGASKEILNIMKPGILNTQIVKIMEKYATKYNCNLPISNELGIIPGVISYQISNGVSDGFNGDDCSDDSIHRFILSRNNPSYGYTLTELELEENEIYTIDIVMSSGSGKLNQTDNTNNNNNNTKIYRRNYEVFESLKLKTSREVLSMFGKETFPLQINTNDIRVKLGLKECIEKQLVEAYPIVSDKDEEYIARVKFTVVVREKPLLICAKSGDTELEKLV